MKSYKIRKALSVAKKAHKGQLYSLGDYVKLHIMPVYNAVKTLVDDRDTACMVAGILHDTLEDTDTTIADILFEFGNEVAEAVIALSRKKDEKYTNYIDRVSKNRIASIVKYADLMNNMSNIPATSWTKKQKMAMFNRYMKAINVIGPIAIDNLREDYE